MVGTARADSFVSDAEFNTVYSTVVKHGGVLAMGDFTWRRVVGAKGIAVLHHLPIFRLFFHFHKNPSSSVTL